MRIRNIVIYRNSFLDFYREQDDKVQLKIQYVLDLIRFERQVPGKFFKPLTNTNGIYEIRVITTFKSIRILCFADNEDLVVLTNAFLKKTQKTPKKEIRIAQRLRSEYLVEKNKDK